MSWRTERRQLSLISLLFLTASCQIAPTKPVDLEATFQAELDALHAQYDFPGATAAYVLPDGTAHVAASGYSDLETGEAMLPQSRMLAASIGKSFVGATAVALAAAGHLDLDAPVSTWLGDRAWFPRLPNHRAMTLRHLLTHSSGLRDHVHSERFAERLAMSWRETGSVIPPEALIEFVLDEPPLFDAGEGWAYSDTGYILAGLIIEAVSDDSYYDQVVKRFLVPLRLGLTTPSDRPVLPLLAAGYLAENNPLGLPSKTTLAPGVMAWNPALEWTGGGLVSNPRDLAVWAKALYEGAAMPGDYLAQLMQSVPIGRDNPGIRYGAGVRIDENTPLGPVYGHGGWIPGYSSSMRYFARHGVAIAIQINTDIGLQEGPLPVAAEVERRLAEVVIAYLEQQ